MPAGEAKQAHEYPLQAGNGRYNNSSDAFKMYFCSDTYASVNESQSPFNLSHVSQVGGGNFPLTGITLVNVSWSRTGVVTTLDYDDIGTLSKNPANPTGIRIAVIVNDTSPADDIYKVIDLTTDGTTPINVVNNDFQHTVNAGGAITGTVA